MIPWMVAVLLAYGAVPLLLPIFKAQSRENYLGEVIPTGLGYAFVISAALVIVARMGREEHGALFALTLLFFATFGAIDDHFGELSKKGFRGHFGDRQLSTGALKAGGGIAVALVIAWPLSSSWFECLINGALIALGANFLNLLDLRPGRAGKTFFILGLLLFAVARQSLGPLMALWWAVVGYLPWDLRRTVMMGDVGSNPLGAALGLACVISIPYFGKVILALVLLGLNILSERVSFSKVIESNRVLQFLDRLGR